VLNHYERPASAPRARALKSIGMRSRVRHNKADRFEYEDSDDSGARPKSDQFRDRAGAFDNFDKFDFDGGVRKSGEKEEEEKASTEQKNNDSDEDDTVFFPETRRLRK
jgi:hypothetical protein